MSPRSGYRTAFIGQMHLGGDVYDSSGQLIRDKDRLNEMDFSRGVRNGVEAHGFDYSLGLQSGIQHEPYTYFENGRYWTIERLRDTFNSGTSRFAASMTKGTNNDG